MAWLHDLASAHWGTATVYTAARLGLADLIPPAGQVTASELATRTSSHPASLLRLLRALVALDVFTEVAHETFGLTEEGEVLRAEHPESVRDFLLFTASPAHWASWGSLHHSVLTGQPAFDHVHGRPFYDYVGSDPELARSFDRTMSHVAARVAQRVTSIYDFADAACVVDVGGGDGTLLTTLLRHHPHLRGVLLELPHVAARARARVQAVGLIERCEIVAGDFARGIPTGDVVMACGVAHNWSDARVVDLLSRMRCAAGRTGRVLLIERILPADGRPSPLRFLDLEMLHATGGRERTEAELRDLLAAAGLRLDRIVGGAGAGAVLGDTIVEARWAS